MCKKRFQTLFTVVESKILPMGAVKTVHALLSFAVALARPALSYNFEEQRWHPTLL